MAAVLQNPEVPETKRFCSKCGGRVGRAKPGRPASQEGFCPECSTRYSFVSKLQPGDVVDRQYEVVGCVARGGLGWVYLARAVALDGMWVVLKGLLDTGDEEALEAAINERRFLVEVEHPNIVRIINFVHHDGESYIVMEYLGGRSLLELRREQGGPLPVERVAEYMLEALPALGYLHRRGLLYCDFKPANLIKTEEQLKLIDLGAVRRLDDDGPTYGTAGYQAPEIADEGPSVSSDLYTVARTLAVLTLEMPGFPERFTHTIPDPDQAPVLERYPAFLRFLLKGMHPDPSCRFQSAREMAEQLRGVLNQVGSIDTGKPHAAPSTLFGPDLGVDARLADWPDLPVPLPDPSDPATAVLSALAAASPQQLLVALESIPDSREAAYQRARAYLEADDASTARRCLETAVVTETYDWRSIWWQGLADLSSGDGASAAAHFEEVAEELPGELAPLVAMGLGYELCGDLVPAGSNYETVAVTDPSYATAVFGLARVRVAQARREEAIAALGRIPSKSSVFPAAQEAIFTTLVAPRDDELNAGDLAAAATTINLVGADPLRRAQMTRALMASALHLLLGSASVPAGELIGNVKLDEPSVRRALEDACRSLAKLAPTEAERIRYVDEANQHRARTLL